MRLEDLQTFEDIKDAFIAHDKSDTIIHDEMRTFIKRMEPVIKVFEDNKVAEAVIEKKTKKITFYIREATTIGALLFVVWQFIKFLLNK